MKDRLQWHYKKIGEKCTENHIILTFIIHPSWIQVSDYIPKVYLKNINDHIFLSHLR